MSELPETTSTGDSTCPIEVISTNCLTTYSCRTSSFGTINADLFSSFTFNFTFRRPHLIHSASTGRSKNWATSYGTHLLPYGTVPVRCFPTLRDIRQLSAHLLWVVWF